MLHADPSQFTTSGAPSQELPLGQWSGRGRSRRETMQLQNEAMGPYFWTTPFKRDAATLQWVWESAKPQVSTSYDWEPTTAAVSANGSECLCCLYYSHRQHTAKSKSISLPPVVCNAHTEQGATCRQSPCTGSSWVEAQKPYLDRGNNAKPAMPAKLLASAVSQHFSSVHPAGPRTSITQPTAA